MKAAFLTLGCKVNAYETEKLKAAFAEAGYTIVPFEEKAEVYIINTCTVTNIADRKSRKMLHRARKNNPDAVVAAVGCYADSAAEKGERDSTVDLFVKNADKPMLLTLVERFLEQRGHAGRGNKAEGEASGKISVREHTRAYLKVQDGCNQYCSYCIIPYVRGALRSRTQDEAVREAADLAAAGKKEIVVTGIHLSSYGVDFTEEKSFVTLKGEPLLALLKRLSAVEGIERIRLGSLEPRIITEEFVKALSQIPKICPHFHLSLQSGSDTVLKRMNRKYTTEEYLASVRILRRYFERAAVTTDVIVGFAQETEAEFLQTMDFARQVQFSKVHVFKYSRRRGTVADAMEGQIPEETKADRSDRLIACADSLEEAYCGSFLGEEQTVLLEEVAVIDDAAYVVGYTEYYVRVAVPADCFADARAQCNTIQRVHITGRLAPALLLAKPVL